MRPLLGSARRPQSGALGFFDSRDTEGEQGVRAGKGMSKTEVVLSFAQLVALYELGQELKHRRRALGISAIALSERIGISRGTLRAVEAGAPSIANSTRRRVMVALGIEHLFDAWPLEFAHTPSKDRRPLNQRSPGGLEAARTCGQPVLTAVHVIQDLQSLYLHLEAVHRAKADPLLVAQALAVVDRWLAAGASRSEALLQSWREILLTQDWRKPLAVTGRGQQLRQSSPLVTTLPSSVRRALLAEINEFKGRGQPNDV